MASTPPAIIKATKNTRLRESMLLGSHLEGGWHSPYPVGDNGTSFGPFQMHDGRGGLSPQQAEDPKLAVRAMMPSYADAVNQITDAKWSSDPESAAEQAAVIAEAPAQSYYSSQGTGAVNAAWKDTRAELTGHHGQGGMPANAKVTSFGGSVGTALGQLVPGIGALMGLLGMGGNLGSNLSGDVAAKFKSGFERIGLVIFGALLVLVGILVLAAPVAEKGVQEAAELRGMGSRAGLVSRPGDAQRQADLDRRQAIADRSNAIGEQKVAIQQQRENRLARRP